MLPLIVSKPLGKRISLSKEQFLNALPSILLTLSGIFTVVKDAQFSNAHIPIVVTLFGIVTLVSPLQFMNA
jgi:hypothetical protein